ncbi:hypothetical protein GUY44_01345 [Pimelobacter simplex]|uniref:hypothetical protein n=1 Tax=Nocardioides simplex TaxID=2045 RepID=UPI0008E62FA2|nr:hypothetical protein [Pimelobacter simplex]MCG8149106.1 hypothetical protein [Pimelobacter simplex]GEB14909.1 hypothetical protein NSI01_32240 [Pimelobacter simplex]SFM23560.1 hypothetical protein SAMN05421671_0507 [Pimelobacter simplex]
MPAWSPIRTIPVGGIVAVGFLDEERVAVGSHAGLGVFDAAGGARLDRVPDIPGEYPWHRDSPPSIVYDDHRGQQVVPAAGLWGGRLAAATADGWTADLTPTGGRLQGPDGTVLVVDDAEEPRAHGFSPGGRVFVHATSSALHVAVRVAQAG